MEQLCREAYLLKKDQVIELREVLEADKDGSNRIDPKIRCHVQALCKDDIKLLYEYLLVLCW